MGLSKEALLQILSTHRPLLLLSRTVAAGLLLSCVVCARLASSAEQSSDPYQGKLLVAQPQVRDPRFAKAVVFVVAHDSTGTMGLVINKVMGEVDSQKILDSLGLEPTEQQTELELRFGGPVELNRGFVLHSQDFLPKTSRPVGSGVAFTADAETVRAIIEHRGPQLYLIAFGYAGWGQGQLEAEIARGDWVVIPSKKSAVFTTKPAELWDELTKNRIMRM